MVVVTVVVVPVLLSAVGIEIAVVLVLCVVILVSVFSVVLVPSSLLTLVSPLPLWLWLLLLLFWFWFWFWLLLSFPFSPTFLFCFFQCFCIELFFRSQAIRVDLTHGNGSEATIASGLCQKKCLPAWLQDLIWMMLEGGRASSYISIEPLNPFGLILSQAGTTENLMHALGMLPLSATETSCAASA